MLAIGGLDTAILKSATLTDSPAARPLAPMLFQVSSGTNSSAQPGAAAVDECLLQTSSRSPDCKVQRQYALGHLVIAACPLQAAPIVRVAIEAKALGDMGALVAGLDLLHRADPLAEVTLQPSGEHVLGAAGAAMLLHHRPNISGGSLLQRVDDA